MQIPLITSPNQLELKGCHSSDISGSNPSAVRAHWGSEPLDLHMCTYKHASKKAFHRKKYGSDLNGLHSASHQGMRALSTPASSSSPAGAEVWAQEGARVASVMTVPCSDQAKKLLEEASSHGPTKLKAALSLRKHRTSAGKTPVRPESMDSPGQVSSSCREAGWEGDPTPLPCSTCTSYISLDTHTSLCPGQKIKNKHFPPPPCTSSKKMKALALIFGCQWPLTCLLARMYTFSFSIFT